jgi:hypothetical protein
MAYPSEIYYTLFVLVIFSFDCVEGVGDTIKLSHENRETTAPPRQQTDLRHLLPDGRGRVDGVVPVACTPQEGGTLP